MLVASLVLSVFCLIHCTSASEDVCIFDVISDADSSDVIAAFNGVTIQHKFQVVGEGRYMFVTTCTDAQPLSSVKFPQGSKVTQYPAEHVWDFQKKYNVTEDWEEDYDFESFAAGKLLTLTYSEMHLPDDETMEGLALKMQKVAQLFQPLHDDIKPIMYVVADDFPIKSFGIADQSVVSRTAISQALQSYLHVLGGPSRAVIIHKRVVVL